MEFNLYAIRDVVADDFISVGFAPSDGAYLRDSLPQILSFRRKEDLEVYRVGSFDSKIGFVTSCDKVAVSWDSYHFPENKTKSLSKDEIIALAAQLEKGGK